MTLDLDEIEKACAAATPGPWVWAEGREMRAPTMDLELKGITKTDDWHMRPEMVARIKELEPRRGAIIETDGGCYGPCDEDAHFIANARAWVPALVEEVRRLRENLDAKAQECLAAHAEADRLHEYMRAGLRNTAELLGLAHQAAAELHGTELGQKLWELTRVVGNDRAFVGDAEKELLRDAVGATCEYFDGLAEWSRANQGPNETHRIPEGSHPDLDALLGKAMDLLKRAR